MSNIEKALKAINKQYGEGTANYLTPDFIPEIKTFPSGSLTLDLAIGAGGIPNGRIIEVFGPTSAGKTTLMLLHIAQVQRAGKGAVAFIDAEHTFNAQLAANYGVDLENLIYINPKNAENAIDSADALIRTGDVRLIVIDSVSALTPSKIVESSIEQQTIGLLARFMSTTCMKLNGITNEYECTVAFINQIRDKVGGFSPAGTPTTTSGGKSLPFYSSLRLNVRQGEQYKDKEGVYGHEMKVKIVKNKVGIPWKEASFPLIYNHGVDKADEIAQIAIIAGFVQQSGAWVYYKDEAGELIVRDEVEYRWNGRAKFADFIRENESFQQELEQKIRGSYKGEEVPQDERDSEDTYSTKMNNEE